MEIKINRDTLYKSISKVQSIIEKRSNMPILSMILISTFDSNISISATDLEISLQQTIPAEVIKQGSITISGRKLFEILKESRSSDIYLKEKENNKELKTALAKKTKQVKVCFDLQANNVIDKGYYEVY
jgi:DNA polymerase-3 subunit beta